MYIGTLVAIACFGTEIKVLINRVKTFRQQVQIAQLRRGTTKTSKYLGVSKCNHTGRWRAAIHGRPGMLSDHIGRYDTEIEAAIAYDQEAYKWFCDGTLLNFPELIYAHRRGDNRPLIVNIVIANPSVFVRSVRWFRDSVVRMCNWILGEDGVTDEQD